jgi:transcriptional regulator GlxA family with amidase domain
MPRIAVYAAAVAAVLLAAASSAPPPTPLPSVAATGDSFVLPPPKAGRTRPLVAIVAENDGAEITDFAVPFGVLRESGVADVETLSLEPGPVQLTPALKVRADRTVAAFDAATPQGADIVIVPAQKKPKDPALAAWVDAQARKGAVIMSICEGARVLAHAGLLEGRRATTHWYALKGLEKAYPRTAWVRDRRYVQDARIISTAGVTASIPASLALVEAIGGRPAALATAKRLGVTGWSAAHRTADYALRRGDALRVIGVMVAPWAHETLEAPVSDGVDELALALRADAWARTFKTKVVTTRVGLAPVRSRRGLVIVPDATPQAGRRVLRVTAGPPASQLDAALHDVGRRYGAFFERLARLGLEYDLR